MKYLISAVLIGVAFFSGWFINQPEYVKAEGVLRDFESIETLAKWLKNDKTNEHIQSEYCAGSAELLIKAAEDDGYRLYFEVLFPDEFEKYFKQKTEYLHACVTSNIDNRIYLIDQYSDRTWAYGDLIR